MMLRFPRLALAVITLGIVTTPMLEARLGKVLSFAPAQGPSAARETCKVTQPSTPTDNPPLPMPGDSELQRSGRFGTDRLWTVLPLDGIWRGLTPKVFGEYAYSNKLPWGGAFSYKNGPLKVSGRRLDGPAPSFTETEPISGVHGMMGGINIPVFGCWEITGRYNNEELSFTVLVAPWAAPLVEPTDSEASQEPIETLPPPRRIQVDAETEATHLAYQINPELPREAQVADISGTVVIEAVVGIDGRPRNLRYLSGPPLLAQAAIDALTWWQYRVDEENTETLTTIPVVFPSTPRPS
jgi:Gram-negative bacterial TonB protein C-terminal